MKMVFIRVFIFKKYNIINLTINDLYAITFMIAYYISENVHYKWKEEKYHEQTYKVYNKPNRPLSNK